MEPSDGLRALPSVDRVLALVESDAPHARKVACIRRALDEARAAVRRDEDAPTEDELAGRVLGLLAEVDAGRLRRVVNATGVLLHTNLGRAPLGEVQLSAVRAIAGGYSNLEYDTVSGARGSRYEHAVSLLRELTGAEAALVVNNNAAAVLLVLAALCHGREVVVSRGELVEIGGEFRIPDVMESSGALLREVGTTNRTHLADYERAITPDTGAILKVHPSNYRVLGFTATVEGRDLARLARGRGVTFVHDLGSGLVAEHPAIEGEPVVAHALEDGADLVTFSGDKLLGGPQAGVIAGRRDLIEKISRHPLLRALRVDKMTLAALDATLDVYLAGRRDELPLWRMLGATSDELRGRAEAVVAAVGEVSSLKIEAVPLRSTTGGGSVPDGELPSYGLRVVHGEMGAAEVQRRLRLADPPLIARVEDDVVVLDLRTVARTEDRAVEAALVGLVPDTPPR